MQEWSRVRANAADPSLHQAPIRIFYTDTPGRAVIIVANRGEPSCTTNVGVNRNSDRSSKLYPFEIGGTIL